jgi:hypothetical protein
VTVQTTKENGAVASQQHTPRNTNHKRNSTSSSRKLKSVFDRTRLPIVSNYYDAQGVTLKGKSAWRDAICPFHTDTKPSLRVRLETGAFRCMVCGAHGGDVLAFHMQRYGMTFKAAAIALGAWVGGAK